jgi:hypothetical protein
MPVRAKFRCTAKTVGHVVLDPDYSDPVNKTWADATPGGHLEMGINNPTALEQFEVGKYYFIDFTPAE